MQDQQDSLSEVGFLGESLSRMSSKGWVGLFWVQEREDSKQGQYHEEGLEGWKIMELKIPDSVGLQNPSWARLACLINYFVRPLRRDRDSAGTGVDKDSGNPRFIKLLSNEGIGVSLFERGRWGETWSRGRKKIDQQDAQRSQWVKAIGELWW